MRMKKDEKAMELRGVYRKMDENQKDKMELLAVNLLNAQKVVENERLTAGRKQEMAKKQESIVHKDQLIRSKS